jgi:hypothetical protein
VHGICRRCKKWRTFGLSFVSALPLCHDAWQPLPIVAEYVESLRNVTARRDIPRQRAHNHGAASHLVFQYLQHYGNPIAVIIMIHDCNMTYDRMKKKKEGLDVAVGAAHYRGIPILASQQKKLK